MAIKMVVNEAVEEIESEVVDDEIQEQEIETETAETEEDEILTIGFEEDSPPQEDEDEEEDEEFEKLKAEPEFAKKARLAFKENSDLRKKLRELEVNAPQKEKPQSDDELGPEPELEDEECNFDAAVFKQRWKEWNEKKTRIESKKAELENKHAEKLNHYQGEKAKLKRPDYDDAENIVRAKLDDAKRNIILYHAKNPAALVYALGNQKSLEKLNALSAMTDYAQFAAEMARMESEMKIDKKPKSAPQPMRQVSGSTPSPKVRDQEMEDAIKRADKTGDRSEILRLNRERERQKLNK